MKKSCRTEYIAVKFRDSTDEGEKGDGIRFLYLCLRCMWYTFHSWPTRLPEQCQKDCP